MSIDSLLTLAGLIVAVYTILPRTRRLDIKLRWGCIDWLIAIAAMLAVICLLFYKSFVLLGWVPQWPLFPWSIRPSDAAFFVVLIPFLAIIIRLSNARLSPNKVSLFRELVEELMWDKRYSELVALIDRYLNRLVQIYKHNQTYAEVTSEIFDTVLSSRQFTSALSKFRPYFATRLINIPVQRRFEFTDLYLRELFFNHHSILYFEIQNNQNIYSLHRYELPESNRLLNFLFSDANIAENLAVWQPIGDKMLRIFDQLARLPDADPYNLAMEDFYERSKWESPLYVGIAFFDIMVSSALYQNISWHMGLYYFPHFTRRIVRNYRPHETLSEPNAEFPTRYSYLLYEMIKALTLWIEAAKEQPPDQNNVVLNAINTNHENGNIPKSSILALSQCLWSILLSENIPLSFKNYLMDIVFRLYFRLRESQRLKNYALVLLLTLFQGGYSEQEQNERFHAVIRDTFEHHDKTHYNYEYINEFRHEFQSANCR